MISRRTTSGYSKKGSDELPFLCTIGRKILGKSQIIRRIHRSALKYKEIFVGNTYMFVFNNDYVEVMFKKSSFMHILTYGDRNALKDLNKDIQEKIALNE